MPKILRSIIATGAFVSMFVAYTPAQAIPPICLKYGWAYCDPKYERLSDEWGACMDMAVAHCEAFQPGGPIPPLPPLWP